MNLLDRFFNWLDQNTPYRCHCGHWIAKRKNARLIEHRTAGWVTACTECWRRQQQWNKGGDL